MMWAIVSLERLMSKNRPFIAGIVKITCLLALILPLAGRQARAAEAGGGGGKPGIPKR